LTVEGKYSVWFKTHIGEGAGFVEIHPDGSLSGGESAFCYSGSWTEAGTGFKAVLSAKRVAPGPSRMFGADELDIVISCRSNDDGSLSGSGFAKQSPGLTLKVLLLRIGND
jgi:hypothetical protein